MTQTKSNKLILSAVLAVGLMFSVFALVGCSSSGMSETEYKAFVSERTSELSNKWGSMEMQIAIKHAISGDKTELDELVSDIRNISDNLKTITPPTKYQEANKDLIDVYSQLADAIEAFGGLTSSSSYDEQKAALGQIQDVQDKISDLKDKYSDLM